MEVSIKTVEILKEEAVNYQLLLDHHSVYDLRKRLDVDGKMVFVNAVDFLLGRNYYITTSQFLGPFLEWAVQYVTKPKNEEAQEA